MFSIASDKALRPNGFTFHFFKTTWSIVEEVTVAFLFFFRTYKLHPAFNSTIVAFFQNAIIQIALGTLNQSHVAQLYTNVLQK